MRQLYPILLFFTLQTLLLQSQSIQPGKVAYKLFEKTTTEPDAFYSVNIVLADRVDLTALDAQLTAQRASASYRSETVINALKSKAAQSQSDLLSYLKNSPLVKPGTVKSYWIANVIFAEIKKEMVAELSQRHDVEWVGLNGILQYEKYEKTPPPSFIPDGKEPGLAVIKAPKLWAMGYTGYGQLAFTNDTGIDPTHPAIAARYRGIYVPPQQTWFQYNPSTGQQGNNYTPFDCDAHGTHVTGTILGLDRLENDTIGVAFNAQWIGAPILCGIGTEDNVAAFQWSIDPDGNPATTDDIPDIINNSWYDPSLNIQDCFSVYVPMEEAMEAAGIAVVFSAGNAGPDSMSITPPHNINISIVSSFTVGALDGNNPSLSIANFSSRGPSQCGGDSSLLIKPEVSAPGVSVRSCIPGNGYDFFSGTSMASPHVSGAILLLKEAFPDLTGKQLKLALYYTCTDLGVPGEDNTYGMGVINVLEAFNYLVAQGHVPVSPFAANDVLLVNMEFSPFSCSEEIAPQIIVENAGTDTLYSFDVISQAGANIQTWQWDGVLAPRQRTTVVVPPLPAAAGTQLFKLTLVNPNGVADDRPLNNRLQRNVFVTTRNNFQVQVQGASNTACENTPALLRGEFNEAGSFEVKWYDKPFGGNLLGEGNTFITPALTETTSFYAEATYTVPLGLKDRTVGETALVDTQDLGMTFVVSAPITLKSVNVFADVTGSRVILLRDQEGGTVYQKVAIVNQTGETTINLNWDIEPGIYSLVKILGKPLYYNTSGADYPYEVDNVIRITGTSDNLGAAGVWYYFYDWKIEFTEPCGRTQVMVEVIPDGEAPDAGFTLSADSIDLINNDEIQFFDASDNDVIAWFWNFGDGTTSTEKNPAHTYTAEGTYVVSLSVTGPDGCTGFALDTILVTKSDLNSTRPGRKTTDLIAVFPNPVQHQISVHMELKAAKAVTLRLTDMTGRTMLFADFPSVQTDVLQLDASSLEAGVYFLLVDTGDRNSVWKIVKI